MHRALPLTLAVLLALPVTAAVPVSAGRYQVVVDGEIALGYLAYPKGFAPTTLLVFGHGCCGKPDQTAFVRDISANYGVVAVAMDHRGLGGWDVMKGHRDLIAATEEIQARFPIARSFGASAWG
jgi:hypothetical protein